MNTTYSLSAFYGEIVQGMFISIQGTGSVNLLGPSTDAGKGSLKMPCSQSQDYLGGAK
jgi:hypothetical protein